MLAVMDSTVPDREERLREVVLERRGERKSVRIERVWRHEGRPVFKFEGIDSISEAELLEGAEILIPESERMLPGEGEFSHAELAGCRILEGPTEIGQVEGIEEFGGPPLLRVRMSDGREVLIPFARSICREIDVRAQRIQVVLPEGLLDLG